MAKQAFSKGEVCSECGTKLTERCFGYVWLPGIFCSSQCLTAAEIRYVDALPPIKA